MSDHTPKKSRYDVFEALASLAAYFERRSITVRITTLLKRVRRRSGIPISRATIFRHLRALERAHAINRARRSTRRRDGTIKQQPTRYTFGLRGILWITRGRDLAPRPRGLTGVSIVRLKGLSTISQRLYGAVDERSTAPSARRQKNHRAPRKRGGR